MWQETSTQTDVDKLYLPRVQDGWELKVVPRMFECRVIAVA